MSVFSTYSNWGSIRDGATTSPKAHGRLIPPPADHPCCARCIDPPFFNCGAPSRSAFALTELGAGAYRRVTPPAGLKSVIPPPTVRPHTTRRTGTPFITARYATRFAQTNWGTAYKSASASPQARIRQSPPLPTRRARSAMRSLIPHSPASFARRDRAKQLEDWRQADLHLPLTHAFGGPSPHLPAVPEDLCRSSFLFPQTRNSIKRGAGRRAWG